MDVSGNFTPAKDFWYPPHRRLEWSCVNSTYRELNIRGTLSEEFWVYGFSNRVWFRNLKSGAAT